jgi:hypothetical protein
MHRWHIAFETLHMMVGQFGSEQLQMSQATLMDLLKELVESSAKHLPGQVNPAA